jgi:hypothetical protein
MRPGARTPQIFSALVGFGVGLYVCFELCIEVSGYIENCRAFQSYSKHSGPGHFVLEVLPFFTSALLFH